MTVHEPDENVKYLIRGSCNTQFHIITCNWVLSAYKLIFMNRLYPVVMALKSTLLWFTILTFQFLLGHHSRICLKYSLERQGIDPVTPRCLGVIQDSETIRNNKHSMAKMCPMIITAPYLYTDASLQNDYMSLCVLVSCMHNLFSLIFFSFNNKIRTVFSSVGNWARSPCC